MNERANVPALMTGGAVSAIIPQSVEEMWRVSTMIVEAGLAPQALIGKPPAEGASDEEWKRWGKKGTSAVATVIMSGAELGLPPMVAMRSFTVIGGRPALFGDGLINVVRRSRKAAYVRTGYDPALKAAWCEAKRSDTGEEKRVEFSEQDARRAGLWDERPTRRGKVWKNGKQEWGDVPNDSTWHRYPQRMLAWRAAGYCLRELFADVLGGITDEFEAREIAGESFIEHETQQQLAPPSPPSPPSPGAPPSPPPAGQPPSASMPDHQSEEEGEQVDDPGEEQGEGIDYGDWFERFSEAINTAEDEASVEEAWSEFDPDSLFGDGKDDDSLTLAHNIKTRRLAALHPANSG